MSKKTTNSGLNSTCAISSGSGSCTVSCLSALKAERLKIPPVVALLFPFAFFFRRGPRDGFEGLISFGFACGGAIRFSFSLIRADLRGSERVSFIERVMDCYPEKS